MNSFHSWPQQIPNMSIEAQLRGTRMPTHEELQKHTDEIMRNAILRKSQQKFQDERSQLQK